MKRKVAIAWSRLGRRTENLARETGMTLLFIPDRPPYLRASRETGKLLKNLNPDIVLVQLPQGPLLWKVVRLSERLRFKIMADVHTGFIYTTTLKEFALNRPFQRLLHKVDFILAHNEPQARLMLGRLGLSKEKVVTIYDPIPQLPKILRKPLLEGLESKRYLVFPASWASDEPLEVIVEEFLKSKVSKNYALAITGKPSRNPRLYSKVTTILKYRKDSDKIILTGFLPDPEYYWLLQNAEAIVAATTREYTMISAVWEAASCRKLFIVSDTITLRNTIGEWYPFFFKLTSGSLKNVLEKCLQNGEVENMSVVVKAIDRLTRLSHESIKKLREKLNEL